MKNSITFFYLWLRQHWWQLLLIILVSIVFKGYRLAELMPFEWDQERDAQMMWQMLKDYKPTLIGPRAVGADGFFLGPWWYYFLTTPIPPKTAKG